MEKREGNKYLEYSNIRNKVRALTQKHVERSWKEI